ncbi:MAG: cytochrome c [Deltaproteobacteria bacterium]|nr:cytochrome c [Deltaproteobacteria bacterium]
MKIPRLLLAVITIGIFYGFFKIFFGVILKQPIPSSLLTMYMFFTVIGVLMVLSFTVEGAKELMSPIKNLLENPQKKLMRNIVFGIITAFAGFITYQQVKPSFEAPLELRTIHPAPPSTVSAYNKSYNLLTLENPFRKYKKEDPAKFKQLVYEGGEVYFKNCFYCHGDKLDGKGHYAHGFNPLPANFMDVGTIAQLQESYLFWRIATGGPGLPKEAAPWLSSMPVWQNFLTEEEIWKVILFLYDYTGYVPRSWEKH